MMWGDLPAGVDLPGVFMLTLVEYGTYRFTITVKWLDGTDVHGEAKLYVQQPLDDMALPQDDGVTIQPL
jgi:hypothetical protein